MPYIDTEILKRNIKVNFMPNVDTDGTVTVENAERYFLNLIEKTTIADVEEVKHGVWIDMHEKDVSYENTYACSVCNTWFWLCEGAPEDNDYDYCPHCGAKMDLKKGE